MKRALIAGAFLIAVILLAQQTRDAALAVRVLDGGRPTAARIHLEDSHGVRPKARGAVGISDTAIPIPKQAIGVMYGQNDRAQGYTDQPDGSFYVEGGFDVRVPFSLFFESSPETYLIDGTYEFDCGKGGPHAICITQLQPLADRRLYEAVFS